MRERFFSLIDALRGADLSTPDAEARSVRAAIVAVANDPEVRTLGGMLYVSRNTTRRGRPDAWLVDVSTDLVIPPNLELRLAPGVALGASLVDRRGWCGPRRARPAHRSAGSDLRDERDRDPLAARALRRTP